MSGLKPEDVPELRMEAEERQNAAYEVHHQKLVLLHVHYGIVQALFFNLLRPQLYSSEDIAFSFQLHWVYILL